MRSNKSRGSSSNRRRSSNEGRPGGEGKKSFKSDKRNERPTRKGEGGVGKSFDKKRSFSPRKRNTSEDQPFSDRKGPRASNSSRGDARPFSEKRSGPPKKRSFDSGKPPRYGEGNASRSFDKQKSFSPRKRNTSEDRPFDERKSSRNADTRRSQKSDFSGERSGPPKKRSFGSSKPPYKGEGSDNRSFDKKKSFSPRKRSTSEERPFSERKDSRGTFSRERSEPSKRSFDTSKRPRRDARKSREDESQEIPAAAPAKMRLNRYIANSGVCSRREADELITMGLISVNGKTITELGFKVNPGDEVRYENKILRAEKPVYLLLNKPKGYLTTTSDPQERNTVMHLIGDKIRERIYPVGRLDRNTTGLLLLTNDGDLADKLMHPSYNVKKIYSVQLDKPLTRTDFLKIQDGIPLEEGKAMVDDLAIISEDGKTVGIELHIGWNRVVRRIFEALEYQVLKLDRSVYAGLDKKDLPRGHWRFLKKEEIIRLKHFK